MRTHEMLKKWEDKFQELKISNYWYEGEELLEWFKDFLCQNGFKFLDSGCCAIVYKHPDENLVIKVCRLDDLKESFYNEPANKNFLPYLEISKDEFCAIQKYVNCSPSARKRAKETFGDLDHVGNYGMDDDKPVLVDLW